MLVRICVKTPVVVPEAGVQLVVGFVVVPQQVPRAEIDAGEPREVTLAPRVAPVEVTELEVGVVTVGTAAEELTVTLVQPLQLSFSFDSFMASVLVVVLRFALSAQARTEHISELHCPEEKVYEVEALLVPPAATAPEEPGEISVSVPPPFDAVPIWKK